MRVALFGGTGYVGSHLVDALLQAGMKPVLLVRPGTKRGCATVWCARWSAET